MQGDTISIFPYFVCLKFAENTPTTQQVELSTFVTGLEETGKMPPAPGWCPWDVRFSVGTFQEATCSLIVVH
jgi:hypothetical protein